MTRACKALRTNDTPAGTDCLCPALYPVVCDFMLAIATQTIVNPGAVVGVYQTGIVISGWVLILISIVLMMLIFLDGIHKLSMAGFHSYFYTFIVLIYVITTIRFMAFVWAYRLH